jgi:hypothetical protein
MAFERLGPETRTLSHQCPGGPTSVRAVQRPIERQYGRPLAIQEALLVTLAAMASVPLQTADQPANLQPTDFSPPHRSAVVARLKESGLESAILWPL